MAALYEAAHGASWSSNGGWLSGDPCGWQNVYCDGDVATHVLLNDNGLRGTLPTELGLLAAGSSVSSVGLSLRDMYRGR